MKVGYKKRQMKVNRVNELARRWWDVGMLMELE
jgi:hypothetical protein